MNSKEQRLQAICNIMRAETVRSQDDLLKLLYNKGYNVTQATLSRDMKQLRIVKQHAANDLYVYALPETAAAANETVAPKSLHIEFSGSLAVIKTRPGYAMGIASDVDAHASAEILGTIAGDDTILVIPREGYSREQIMTALAPFLYPAATV
ncbi:MAG: ArgR family transcriptional regulator [Tannerella sp.]|jgi:transcriptional regulator of arginine metabolism|nr:ArgR family transcriptional regulator [Tannerella sp.]